MKKRLLAVILILVMSLSACAFPFNKTDKDEDKENSKENSNNENSEVGEADLNALLGYDAEKLFNTEEVKDFEDIDIEANVKPYDVPKDSKMIGGFVQDEYTQEYNAKMMKNLEDNGFFVSYAKCNSHLAFMKLINTWAITILSLPTPSFTYITSSILEWWRTWSKIH